MLCGGCVGSLVPGSEGACPRCGGLDLDSDPGIALGLCGDCLATPPPYARARGAFAYGGALAHGITRWKAARDATLSAPMARLFARADWEGWIGEAPDKVVFVPPDPRRFRRRGFHPAGILARALAAELGAPLDPRAISTRRSFDLSRGQTRRARRERLRGVFSVERLAVQGARLLLVDDVMTTGATVSTLARACMARGAAQVEVAVLARAPRYRRSDARVSGSEPEGGPGPEMGISDG
jgi:predicted amidophosphoribosyltransferase